MRVIGVERIELQPPRYLIEVHRTTFFVIPAQAGIQGNNLIASPWTPACAGVTKGKRNSSIAHQRAVGLPEATDRGFGGAGLLGRVAVSAHLHDRARVLRADDRALHEAADRAVFH